MTQNDHMVNTFADALELSLKIVADHSKSRDEHTSQIKEVIKNLCILENDFTTSKTALQNVNSEEADENDDYESELRDLRKGFSYKNHEIWKRLNGVSEEEPEDVAMDESLVLSNNFTIPIDPLTKRAIQNACRNSRCNHVYEYDTIMQYLSRRTTKNRCPYIGCTNNMLHKNQIEKDPQLQDRINNCSVNESATNISIVNISL